MPRGILESWGFCGPLGPGSILSGTHTVPFFGLSESGAPGAQSPDHWEAWTPPDVQHHLPHVWVLTERDHLGGLQLRLYHCGLPEVRRANAWLPSRTWSRNTGEQIPADLQLAALPSRGGVGAARFFLGSPCPQPLAGHITTRARTRTALGALG